MRHLVLVLFILLLACCNPYATAWKSASSFRELAFQVEAGMSQVARDKSQECLQKHGDGTPAYRDCVKAHLDALKRWRDYGRPAVNSALVLTASALQIAENSKDKKLPWLEYLKPGLCTLCVVTSQWYPLLPVKVKQQITTVCTVITVATCPVEK